MKPSPKALTFTDGTPAAARGGRANDLWRPGHGAEPRPPLWDPCWKEEAELRAAGLRAGEGNRLAVGAGGGGPGGLGVCPVAPGLPKPADTEVYNKMTPFFSIFLDSGFYSSHYGTELET